MRDLLYEVMDCGRKDFLYLLLWQRSWNSLLEKVLRCLTSVRWRGLSMMDNSFFSVKLSTTASRVSCLQQIWASLPEFIESAGVAVSDAASSTNHSKENCIGHHRLIKDLQHLAAHVEGSAVSHSMSGVHRLSFTWTCPGLHHLSFPYSAIPPPFLFPLLITSLSAWTVLKPGTAMLWSRMCEWSHGSMNHNTLHSQHSVWVFISGVSSSVLFLRNLTFPITIAGTSHLYLLFFTFCFALGSAAPPSPLQLLQDLRPRSRQQCRFTQRNLVVACVNSALTDALLTLHCQE